MHNHLDRKRSGVLPPSATCQLGFDKKTIGIHPISGCNKEPLSLPFHPIMFFKVQHNGFLTWKLLMKLQSPTFL